MQSADETSINSTEFEVAIRDLLRVVVADPEDLESVLAAQEDVRLAFERVSLKLVEATGWSLAWWDQDVGTAAPELQGDSYAVTVKVRERNAKRATKELARLLAERYPGNDVTRGTSSYEMFVDLIHELVAEVDEAVDSALVIDMAAWRGDDDPG